MEDWAAIAANEFLESKIALFGVPDSTLSELIYHFEKNPLHQVAANEGSAVGMAIGYWLQTKNPAHVYMQNSGLLNAGNPLIALAHKNVYDVPIKLTIGWRGKPEPNVVLTDEPQHIAQGNHTIEFLEAFDFKVRVATSGQEYVDFIQEWNIIPDLREAILVPRGIFDKRIQPDVQNLNRISRLEAIDIIYGTCISSHVFVSGTGYMSRDLAAVRSSNKKNSRGVFYLVGGMGHVASVAAGLSIGGSSMRVAAIEGDGGAFMHLGAIATLGLEKSSGVDFFIIKNDVHASVGGQNVLSPNFDFIAFGEACGFASARETKDQTDLQKRLNELSQQNLSAPSTLTVVQVQEYANIMASARPSGFAALARDFGQLDS